VAATVGDPIVIIRTACHGCLDRRHPTPATCGVMFVGAAPAQGSACRRIAELGDTERVSDWNADGSVPGPLLALGVVALLMVLLRWAFGRGHSLVQRASRRGTSEQYGLLVRIASPKTVVEAEQLRLRLEAAGLRATLAPTVEGPAIMVFPEDVETARALLEQPGDAA
jgi:hypothetical protein